MEGLFLRVNYAFFYYLHFAPPACYGFEEIFFSGYPYFELSRAGFIRGRATIPRRLRRFYYFTFFVKNTFLTKGDD
jgi:hypothetical protein